MTNPKEIWKPIPGYEGVYEVSNYGRVRSLDRYIKVKNSLCKRNGKILKAYKVYDGINGIKLSHDNKRENWIISHLVMWVFGDYSHNSNKYVEIGYRDGNKGNLYIDNLYIIKEHDKSDYGVHKINNKWQLTMTIDGKCRYMGEYFTKEQAKNVRDTVLDIYKETGKIVYPQKRLRHARRAPGTGSISFKNGQKKWVAGITENKQDHHLGTFSTKEEAEAALGEYMAKRGDNT
jgi:hypothetical protein